LKLIEEPPKQTIFILCTTDPQKIPETVLSRLVKIDFRKGNKKELRASLKKIIEGEEIEIEKEAMEMLLEKSDGSFRNLQRTFNEIFLQLGKKMDLESVSSFFKNQGGTYLETDFEEDILKGEVKPILEKLETMAEKGVDFQIFRENLILYFQQKVLACYGVGEGEKSKLSLSDLEILINLLIKAAKQEKEVEIDQLPMELAVVEFLGEGKESKDIKVKVEEKKEEIKIEAKEEPKKKADETSVSLSIEELEKSWCNILLSVKPFNHSIEAFLRAARPKTIRGNSIILEVFYPFHKDRLEEAKNRKVVEEVLCKVLGMDLGFECTLAKTRKQPLVISNDTPEEKINDQLVENNKKDLYDVAKEIFG
jgi:DNA polymerase III gamma/tau subunit